MNATQSSNAASDVSSSDAASTRPEIRIDAWFDVRCPWCYVGDGRLKRGIEQFHETHPDVPVNVTHHSYQLAPNIPDRFDGDEADYMHRYEGHPLESARAWVPQMRELAATEGLDLRFDELQQVNTWPAHRLFHFAKRSGESESMVELLFESYFTKCLDLSDTDVLAAIGEQVGLDRNDAREAVLSAENDDAIRAEHVRAQMLGANGVPFFYVNAKYPIAGAREPEVMAKALSEVVRREQES
ncbi:MAG: DsbA family oxidoreductase [Canibacter sp.]